MWNLKRYVLTWALAFLVFVIGLDFLTDAEGHGWRIYYELKQAGRATLGQVTRAEPGNHQTIYYSFRVGPIAYDGAETGHTVSLGSPVRVIYSPRDPAISCLKDPGGQFLEQVVLLLAASTAFALAVSVAIWRMRRVRQAR